MMSKLTFWSKLLRSFSAALFFAGILLTFLPILSKAQTYYNKWPEYLKANSHWAFGNKAGLDFNSGGPKPIKTERGSNIAFSEGGAAVSDRKTGNLLFYSDGARIWNASHKIMPNGSKLLGSGNYAMDTLWQTNTRQGTCIVPVIRDTSKYYLFSLAGWTSLGPLPEGSLFYNVIDMNLDNGLGDIIPGKKNISIDSDSLSEGMIAIPGDNCDIWLVVHRVREHVFKSYHITQDGIDTVPVISNTSKGLRFYGMGTIAVSPDRTKIAFTCQFSARVGRGILLCNFDAATGRVTNPMEVNVNYSISPVGACFSPDNSKLYVSATTTDNTGIGQFDLSVYDSASICNSFTKISDVGYDPIVLYNDTIYFSMVGNSSYVPRIVNPNLAGAACGLELYAIRLLDSTGIVPGSALQNNVVMPVPITDTLHILSLDTFVCQPDFSVIAPPGHQKVLWDDGSTNSERVLHDPGKYWVISNDGCTTRVDTFIVRELDPPEAVISINKNILATTTKYYSYQWLLDGVIIPGATDSVYEVSANGEYQVIVATESGCIDTSGVYLVTNFGNSIEIASGNFDVDIYPNPAFDKIHVRASFPVDILITDLTGREVKRTTSSTVLSIADLPSGSYFVQVYYKSTTLIRVKKVIKL